MTDRKPLDVDPPTPSIVEALDAVRCEDQVEVERAVLELHEVLASRNLPGLLDIEREPQFSQRGDDCATVLGALLHEKIGVLGGVGEAEQNGARFADEEIPHVVMREDVADFLGLPVLKRAHSPANPGGCLRTSGDSRRSCRRP